MTKVVLRKIVCKKCGKESDQADVCSVNFLLGSKKDNKKLLKAKQTCPHCGYSAKHID